MKKKNLFKVLTKALENKCPERFSLSGSEAKNNDYFSLQIYKDGEPYLLIQKITDTIIEGLQWNGNRFKDILKLDIEQIDLNTIDITHYHNTSIITFDSINDYRFHRITRLIYISEFIKRHFNNFRQFLFNQKNLVLKQRMVILKTILKKYFEDSNFKFDTLSILTLIHSSKKWILHPKHDLYIKEMDMYLDSFVYSKDLSKNGLKYSVNPKAIITLNDYEENDRKYRKQVNLQRWMVVATIAIAFFASVQIYLKYTD